MFTEVLSPLQQKIKPWHEKLSHLHPKSMFRLAKLGFFPSIFLYLKDDVTRCASCMFETTSRMQWITRGKKLGPISKETDNKPVSGVSVAMQAWPELAVYISA